MGIKWGEVGGAVARLAPGLATAIGGPLAGTAVATIESALGVKPHDGQSIDDRQDAVAAAISGANADQLLSLKKADQDFQVKMAELGFDSVKDLESLSVQDRESARTREQVTKDWAPRALAVAVTIGFFGILGSLLFRAAPDGSKDILNIMLGALGAAFTSLISYYYGSSSGSDRKTEILAAATPAQTPSAK